MQPTVIERPAAGGNRGPAKYIDLGQDYLAEQLFKRKTDSPSKDKWPILVSTRAKNLERLSADRTQLGTLTKEAMDVIRAEWTWTQIALGKSRRSVMLRLTHVWPVFSHSEVAAMTEPELQKARELQEERFSELIEWAEFRPTWTAPLRLGNELKVTPEERKRLDLRLIRYAGQTDAIMKQEQRLRDRERAKARRRVLGMKPRSEWLAEHNDKPWIAEGITQRTWQRRKKKQAEPIARDVSQVCPRQEKIIPSNIIEDTPASHPHNPAEGGARDRAPHPTRRPTIRERPCVSPHRTRLLRDLKLMVADLWAGRPPQPPPAPVPERLQ